jgi:hypothetical protein
MRVEEKRGKWEVRGRVGEGRRGVMEVEVRGRVGEGRVGEWEVRGRVGDGRRGEREVGRER